MPRRDYIGQYYINSGVVQEIKSIRQQILQLQRSHVKLPPVQLPKNTLTKKPKKKTKTPLPETTIKMKTFFGDFLRPYPTETFFGGNLPYNKMETFFGFPLGMRIETFFGVELDDIGGGAGGFTGPPTYVTGSQTDSSIEALLATGPIFIIAKAAGFTPTLTGNSDCTVETLITSSADANNIGCRIFYVYKTGPSPSVTKNGNFGPCISIPGGEGASVSNDSAEGINNTNGGAATSALAGTLTPGNVAVAIFSQIRGGTFSGGPTWTNATYLGGSFFGWQDSADSTTLALTAIMTDIGTSTGSHIVGAYVEVAPSP